MGIPFRGRRLVQTLVLGISIDLVSSFADWHHFITASESIRAVEYSADLASIVERNVMKRLGEVAALRRIV